MPRSDKTSALPSQSEMVLPLLDEIQKAGGSLRSREAYERLADRLEITPEARDARVPIAGGTRTVSGWARSVRWTQQRARMLNLIEAPSHGVWSLTGPGEETLRNARPGVVVVVYVTEMGVALWADAHAAAGVIEDGSVNAFICSPPYPLLEGKRRAYENQHAENEHVEWLLGVIEQMIPKTADDGSIVLNVGNTWVRGQPVQSLWIHKLLIRAVEDLGLFNCQPHAWYNPAKMPTPAEWVTVRRVRVKDALEPVLWLAKSPEPKADNRRVLVPYSDAMRRTLDRGGEKAQSRPSGHDRQAGAFSIDHGGAIPTNLITASNTDSQSPYFRKVKGAGLPVHPARFPSELPAYFISYLTAPNDLIGDLFFGSGTVGAEAERLGRRWVGADLSLAYLNGSGFRFQDCPGFRSHIEGVPGAVSLLPEQGGLFAA